jgi:hypothetical protein
MLHGVLVFLSDETIGGTDHESSYFIVRAPVHIPKLKEETMSKRKSMVLAFAGAIMLGCATGVVMTDLFAPPAVAEMEGSNQFSECFAATTWEIMRQKLNAGNSPRDTLKIPQGWTPVSGAGSPNGIYVILCR